MDSASGSSCQMTRLIGRDRVEVLYRLPRDQWMTTALVAPAVSDASQADLKSLYQLTAVAAVTAATTVTAVTAVAAVVFLFTFPLPAHSVTFTPVP